MRPANLTASDDRPILSLLHIRSPLTRVAYRVPADSACLVLLFAGKLTVSEPGAATGTVREFEAPRLIWIPAGKARDLGAPGGTRGMVMLAPRQTLVRSLPASLLADQMGILLREGISQPLGQNDAIVRLLDGVATEKQANLPGSSQALEHYLGLILLHLWRMLGTDIISRQRSPRGLAERFVMLTGQHRHQHWTVERYAEALEVKRDRLNVSVRRATGLSPQAYLHREIMRDACELLASTGLPVSQIAFRLGFADPAYFNRFFTRQSGQTPGKYRHVLRSRKEQGDLTYAAWP
ncbi:helix-turn-helix domain-containing protein [Hoeflea alexandrii]|uniref:Helix-turn-helix domain-containing protein n=2 Tax=Hoeflea alexandrii TaxID=288436 RepID=A0ABT1CVU5_9HYPH|nr:helix-turn-helix domain-containing protein [Hoeflea alexandrii]MBV6649106.1 helix-turn-helix domain-containing protein [Hoeflea sp.]MCO6410328.1 helix-turn-helix domain-containing protein [Hoeflea alexandrii]